MSRHEEIREIRELLEVEAEARRARAEYRRVASQTYALQVALRKEAYEFGHFGR